MSESPKSSSFIAKGSVATKDVRKKYLNKSETVKLIQEIKTGIKPQWQSRYIILVGLATGLRFSEILALAWSDVDFKNKTIKVTKAYDYTHTKKIQKTKTESSKRIISIDNDTLVLLKQYKLATQINQSKYVFLDKNLESLSNNAVNKSLKKACQRAGITEITFHSLRHTHCSLLIYQGVNIKYISKRLGHSTISITYQIYGHVLDELEQRESSKVDDMMQLLYNA
ncbi:tyrosine-type recombinase/integrase [Marinilactibacillus sp. GCM10026970]|uniref:tyrosine-type recombinase/integrase n=1 Tax=Marinilactibacillus sp. GCM10026970 TaxID=3252642 RepID=UPI00361B1470